MKIQSVVYTAKGYDTQTTISTIPYHCKDSRSFEVA